MLIDVLPLQMQMDTVYSWPSVLGACLAVAVAWRSWHILRDHLQYDLHKIPGPQGLPVIGNLHQILGTSYIHKVACEILFPMSTANQY